MAAPIYKQSALARTVFYLLALAVSATVAAGPTRAEVNPAYTVEGVEVDVTDKNAVAAREKALEEAQVKAYKMLAERMTGTAADSLKIPDPVTISSLVQDFEVTREQLSSKRYKGTYTVRFRPTATKNQLASQGGVVSDHIAKPVLVLPFYQVGDETLLWADGNPFMRAWRSVAAEPNMPGTAIVPIGDAEDIAQLDDAEGLGADPMRVQQLATRYRADDVAILVASTEPTQTSQGRLVVNIYNNGFEGPSLVQKVVLDQTPGETEEATYARMVQKLRAIFRQNWKANTSYAAAPAQPQVTTTTQTRAVTYGSAPGAAAPIPYTRQALGPSQTYGAYARFASVQDWVRMKNALDRTYGVQAVLIKALKPREALLDIRYAGNITALQLALQNSGISLRAGANGALELTSGATPTGIYR